MKLPIKNSESNSKPDRKVAVNSPCGRGGRILQQAAKSRLLLVLTIAALPLLLGAGELGRQEYEVRRKRIAEMTASERKRLQHKTKIFGKLSEKDRQRYVALDRELEKDPKLRRILKANQQWLRTISPWQQDELRKESLPDKRVALVRKIKRQQAEKRQQEQKRRSRPRWSSRFTRQKGRMPMLDSADLAAVMKVVEENLPTPPETLDDPLTSAQRHLRVLTAAVKQQAGPERPGRVQWPENDLSEKMIAAISDERKQNRFRGMNDPKRRRRMLARVVVMSVFAEWRDVEQREPTREELEKFFRELDENQRDRITSIAYNRQKLALIRMYHRRELIQLQSLLQELFPRQRSFRSERPRFERPNGKSSDDRRPRRRQEIPPVGNRERL